MIIGIGHVARTGKDTAAEALVRELGFKRVGFADPLKALAFEADPLITSNTRTVNISVGHGRLAWTVKGLGWEEAKNTYPEVRKFLQNLGIGARKVFGEDFWVERTLREASRHQDVVIPDVRFENEADAIQAAGGILIRIDRPGHVAGGHVSETELVDYPFDHVVSNEGSIEDLQSRMIELVQHAAVDRAESKVKAGA